MGNSGPTVRVMRNYHPRCATHQFMCPLKGRCSPLPVSQQGLQRSLPLLGPEQRPPVSVLQGGGLLDGGARGSADLPGAGREGAHRAAQRLHRLAEILPRVQGAGEAPRQERRPTFLRPLITSFSLHYSKQQ